MTRFVHLPTSRRHDHPSAEVADPDEIIEVTVRLRRRSPLSAAHLGAPLPRRAFAARHGARQRDIAAVEAHAAREGLEVVSRSAAARSVVLRGPLGAMCRAFPADVRRVEVDGTPYRRRVGDSSIPTDLDGIVEGIFGFTNVPHARPYAATSTASQRAQPHSRGRKSRCATDLAKLYRFPEGYDGRGECIGILEFGGGYRDDDLDRYFQAIESPRPVVVPVSVGRARNLPGGRAAGADVEVALDIQVAGSVAPGARIAVYFAEWTERGWIDALAAAIHDQVNRPSVICVCWGWAELEANNRLAWSMAAIEAVNDALHDAAALGVTVLCASGDDGSSDGVDDDRPHVDFPASSPWVLACGGTSVALSDGAVVDEVVWNDGPRARGGGAGGGGVSDVIDLPDWQSEAGVPLSMTTGHRGRGVPDVAGLAGGEYGYTIHLGGEDVKGVIGTSAVAPLYAGLFARINQALGRPVGHVNPTIYRSGAARDAMHDIVRGDNDVLHIGAYTSSPGWDACTGWGRIDGQKLLDALSTPVAMGGDPPYPPARPAPRVSHITALKPLADNEDTIDEIA